MTEINKLAIFLKVSYDTDKETFIYNLPIKKLYDVSVICKIIITKSIMRFVITAPRVTMYDEDGDFNDFEMVDYCIMKKNDATEYVTFVTKIFEIIQEWKFDLLSGKLLPPVKIKVDDSVFEIFRNLSHVKLAFDKCSVCHEMTKTNTYCGHSLCILCWDKIYPTAYEHNDDNDDGFHYKPCPVCRGKMEYK